MAGLQRKADAVWQGNLREGNGKFSASSGAFKDASYSFATRFENNPGTNPEELIAAAHASCFSMAFANELDKAGFKPNNVRTTATVTLDKRDAGFSVTHIRLDTVGSAEGIDEARFQQIAEAAKNGCPISRLLKPGVEEIELVARLER